MLGKGDAWHARVKLVWLGLSLLESSSVSACQVAAKCHDNTSVVHTCSASPSRRVPLVMQAVGIFC